MTRGLPTPNLFAGEHNFHSCLEWVSVQDMEKAVEAIVNLCCVWEEHSEPGAGRQRLQVNTLRQDA
jgi:di/tripeptidase